MANEKPLRNSLETLPYPCFVWFSRPPYARSDRAMLGICHRPSHLEPGAGSGPGRNDPKFCCAAKPLVTDSGRKVTDMVMNSWHSGQNASCFTLFGHLPNLDAATSRAFAAADLPALGRKFSGGSLCRAVFRADDLHCPSFRAGPAAAAAVAAASRSGSVAQTDLLLLDHGCDPFRSGVLRARTLG